MEKDNTKYTEHFGEKKTLISKISITGISKNIARGKKILLKANIYPTEASNKMSLGNLVIGNLLQLTKMES